MKTIHSCRICHKKQFETIISYERVLSDGIYLKNVSLERSSPQSYPLTLLLCRSCGLLQLREIIPTDIYDEYNFASAHIEVIFSWMKKISKKLIDNYHVKNKNILELGSGDGSFLTMLSKTNTVLGIEPSELLVNLANKNGAPTQAGYFSSRFAKKLLKKHGKFNVVILRHILEHINILDDFMTAVETVLADNAIVYIESPNAKKIIQKKNYFNIFYEHVNYFSLDSMQKLCLNHSLFLVNHGYNTINNGSFFGIFSKKRISSKSLDMINKKSLEDFRTNFSVMQRSLIALRYSLKGKIVAGYGAANKTFSILNIGNFKKNEIKEIYDKNTHLHGKYIPYYSLPIVHPNNMLQTNPSHIIIFATAYQDEIIEDIKKIGFKGNVITLFPKIKNLSL